jgi:hypothetical protein
MISELENFMLGTGEMFTLRSISGTNASLQGLVHLAAILIHRIYFQLSHTSG